MNKTLLTTAIVLFTGTYYPSAFAGDGNSALSLSVTSVSFNDSSSDLAGPNTPPDARVVVGDETILSGTYTRKLTDDLDLEVLIGAPTELTVTGVASIDPLGQVATTKALSPTIGLRYNFDLGYEKLVPFVNISANYTTFYDEETTAPLEAALSGQTSLELEDSFGLAAFAGVDYHLNDKFFLSAKIGRIQMETTGTLVTDTVIGGTSVGEISREIDVEMNPTVTFIGGGIRF